MIFAVEEKAGIAGMMKVTDEPNDVGDREEIHSHRPVHIPEILNEGTFPDHGPS